MCCWTHRTARILVTRAHYPVGPVSYSLLYTALMAMEDTKTCSSRAIEDQHGQLAETPPAIEVNRGEPAETSHQPVLAVFVAPFFCLSLFSWFPLLLRRIQHNNNSQGFLYNHSWQALSRPSPPAQATSVFHSQSFVKMWPPFWQKITLKHQTRRKVPKPLALFSLILWTCVTNHAAVSSLYAAWPPGAG